MKSKSFFDLSPEGSRSLQPVVMLHIDNSDDVRDSVAEHFHYRMGLNHNILKWDRKETPLGVWENRYSISNFKPDSQFVLLDVTAIYGVNNLGLSVFREKLQALCAEFNVEINTEITDGLMIRESDQRSELPV